MDFGVRHGNYWFTWGFCLWHYRRLDFCLWYSLCGWWLGWLFCGIRRIFFYFGMQFFNGFTGFIRLFGEFGFLRFYVFIYFMDVYLLAFQGRQFFFFFPF